MNHIREDIAPLAEPDPDRSDLFVVPAGVPKEIPGTGLIVINDNGEETTVRVQNGLLVLDRRQDEWRVVRADRNDFPPLREMVLIVSDRLARRGTFVGTRIIEDVLRAAQDVNNAAQPSRKCGDPDNCCCDHGCDIP